MKEYSLSGDAPSIFKHLFLQTTSNKLIYTIYSYNSSFRSSSGDIPPKTGGDGWPGLGRSKRDGGDLSHC